jgi:hypothetical protein
LNEARVTVEAILRDAGVHAAWRTCRSDYGAASKSDDSCADAVNPAEVVVRLMRAPPKSTSQTLGFSYVDTETRRGTLATIFADRIHARALRLRISVGQLLGRAIAHEVGHLLLGTSDHAANGLMLSRWTDRVLTHERERDWLFSDAEAADMRRLVLVRTQGISETARLASLRNQSTGVR